MEHLCKNYVYRVESLQSWCAARTTYCDSSYVTIATYYYLLPALYFPKMKNALLLLLLQSLPHFLVLVLCNVHIPSDRLNEHQEQITLLEGGKLLFYPLNGEGLDPIVLPWKCHSGHIMELCDEYNNCTNFQFYTEDIFRDIPFFMILHHFVY